MQELDNIPELEPNFYSGTENNENIANNIYCNNIVCYANDFVSGQFVTFNEFAVQNDIHVPLAKDDVVTNTMEVSDEITTESYYVKEAENNESVNASTTETTTPDDTLTEVREKPKTRRQRNKKQPLNYKIAIDIKRNESNVEIEIKNLTAENVLSEFLYFKNSDSIEASKPTNIDEDKELKSALIKQTAPTVYNEAKYKCDTCNNEFNFKMDLLRHFANKHGHRCKECGYKAKTPYHLMLHSRRHTGEKPYNCHLCKYTCRRIDMLKRHYLKHSNIKPYICNTCSNRFKSLKNLKQHVKYKCASLSCTFCPLKFTSATDLNNHKETHEDANYVCKVCGWKYKSRQGLHRHRRIHEKDPALT